MDWLTQNQTLLWWLGVGSVAMFVGTLAFIPLLVARLPVDYFASPRRHPPPWCARHPGLTLFYHLVKNVLGVLFLVGGFIMLFTPGQGLLSLLIGVSLTDFPGKYRLERALVSRPGVARAVQWMRRKAGREPLQLPEDG